MSDKSISQGLRNNKSVITPRQTEHGFAWLLCGVLAVTLWLWLT